MKYTASKKIKTCNPIFVSISNDYSNIIVIYEMEGGFTLTSLTIFEIMKIDLH